MLCKHQFSGSYNGYMHSEARLTVANPMWRRFRII